MKNTSILDHQYLLRIWEKQRFDLTLCRDFCGVFYEILLSLDRNCLKGEDVYELVRVIEIHSNFLMKNETAKLE